VRDKVADVLLFNPYHDRLGRFTSKRGGARFGGAIPGKKGGPIGLVEREVFGRAAEYLSRKKGIGPKLLRTVLDLGIDRVLWALAGSSVAQGFAVLGAMAAASLIGIPTLGAVAGLVGGVILWSMITEPLTDRALYGFINHYSPRDDAHAILTTTRLKKTGRLVNRVMMVNPMAVGGEMAGAMVMDVGAAGGGGIISTAVGIAESGVSPLEGIIQGILGASSLIPLEEEGLENITAEDMQVSFIASILPATYAIREGILDKYLVTEALADPVLDYLGIGKVEVEGKSYYLVDKKEAKKILAYVKRTDVVLSRV